MSLDRTLDDRLPPIVTATDPAPDAVTYTDFEKRTRLGSGGTATVYRAVCDDGPVEQLAVKELDWDGNTVDQSSLDAFLAEAELWAQVDDHPHIGAVFGAGSHPSPWIAMEYFNAGTLAARMPVEDVQEALWIGSAVADSLQHAHHQGVAHLDLKPSNVLLEATGDTTWNRPKVVDWGAATTLHAAGDPDLFTPGYAAPEQVTASDDTSVGPLTDVYQLGALVYALLTGHPPDSGDEAVADPSHRLTPPSELRDALPPEFDSVVLSALAPTPADRVRTAAQFSEACADCFRAISARTDASSRPADVTSNDAEVASDEPAASASRTDPISTESRDAPVNTGSGPSETTTAANVFTPPDGDHSEGSDAIGPDQTANDRRHSIPVRTASSGWFSPAAYPEVQSESESLDDALRTKPENNVTDGSLSAALRDISTAIDDDTLASRLSTVHATGRGD